MSHRPSKIYKVLAVHGSEPQVRFSTRQSIFEFGGAGERRRPCGENTDPRIMVGCDLQKFGWIFETMYFIQHDAAGPQGIQKRFGIFEPLANARLFAVEVLDLLHILTKDGLTGTPHPRPQNARR